MTDITAEQSTKAAASVAPAGRRRRGSVTGLAAATYAGLLLGLVTGPLTARALGPTGRGQVAAVAVYGAMLPLILGSGLPVALGRVAALRPELRPALLGAAVRWTRWLAIPGAAVGFGFLLLTSRHLGMAGQVAAAVTLIPGCLGVLDLSVQQLLLVEGALRPISIRRLLPLLTSAVGLVVLFSVGALSIASYLWLVAATAFLPLVYGWRALGVRPTKGYPLRGLTLPSLKVFAGQVAQLANDRLDQMLMVPLLSRADLGFYAIAVTVASLPLGLSQAVAARSVGDIARASEEARRKVGARFVRLNLLVAGLLCAALALVIPWAIPLVYGGRFRDAVVPALLLLPGAVFLAGAGPGNQALWLHGKYGGPSIATGAGLLVTVAGLAIFLRPFGVVAAAAVTSAGNAATYATTAFMLRRLGVSGLRPGWKDTVEVTRIGYAAAQRLARLAWLRPEGLPLR